MSANDRDKQHRATSASVNDNDASSNKSEKDVVSPSAAATSTAKPKTAQADVAELPGQSLPVKPHWYRSTFFNATVLGIASLCSPGIWGAMNSLGAGGQSSPAVVNAANAMTFVLMIFTSWGTSSLINLTSVPIALAIGTSGYSIYAAGLYLSSKTAGQVTWLVLVGAAACGVSAGFFWSTEGAVILSYPERNRIGRYVSYWLMFRVLGQLLGGAINLGLNAQNGQKGMVSTQTYAVFIALQCLAPFVALTLSRPEKVQRHDGTRVVLNLRGSVRSELLAVWRLLCQRRVAMLLPMIWQTTFSESLTGTYAVLYFTVRSRALGSFLSAIVASLGNYALGFFLDWRKISINRRSKWAFAAVYGMQGGWWIFAIVLMRRLHDNPPERGFDWSNQSGFSVHFALYIMLQLGFNLMYELTYWTVAGINDDGGETVRLASIVRGVESAGQALSYGINSTSWRLDAVAGLNTGFYAVCLVPAGMVISKIGLLQDGTRLFEPLVKTDEGLGADGQNAEAGSKKGELGELAAQG